MIFNLFPKKSAATAKSRLSLVLAVERSQNVPYLEDMKNEIIKIVQKYNKGGEVRFKADANQNLNVLEIEILLDDRS